MQAQLFFKKPPLIVLFLYSCMSDLCIAAETSYQDQHAVVLTKNMSVQEQRATENRLRIVQKNLLEIAGINRPLKVALVLSGGGYRAMVVTLGFLQACQETRLLDMLLWTVGLSGSSWALNGWHASGMELDTYRKALWNVLITSPFDLSLNELSTIQNRLLKIKKQYGRLTLVDMYGDCLAQRLITPFRNDVFQVKLSEQELIVRHGARPLPLYCAVRAGKDIPFPWWYEITPFQWGSEETGYYAPIDTMASVFNNGVVIDKKPEYYIGFQMGMMGSAFAANFKKSYEKVGRLFGITGKSGDFSFATKRIKYSWAEVNNMTHKFGTAPLTDKETIKLVDAGLAFNIPYPLVSGYRPERLADIIIVLDMSAHVTDAKQLKYAQQFAQRHALPFPEIDLKGADGRLISVYKGNFDQKIPTVIYIPWIQNSKELLQNPACKDKVELQTLLATFDPLSCVDSSFCATQEFAYKIEQSKALDALGRAIGYAVYAPIVTAFQNHLTGVTAGELQKATPMLQ